MIWLVSFLSEVHVQINVHTGSQGRPYWGCRVYRVWGLEFKVLGSQKYGTLFGGAYVRDYAVRLWGVCKAPLFLALELQAAAAAMLATG